MLTHPLAQASSSMPGMLCGVLEKMEPGVLFLEYREKLRGNGHKEEWT